MTGEQDEARGGLIQSLERGFAILEEVSKRSDGATLSEISRATGLHTSTLYHLTRTLVALGYLRPGQDDKRYRMGRGIYQLASACLDEAQLCLLVEPFLDRLAAATGEATHLAVWEREKALILTRRAGPNALQIAERAGTLRPVYCTAIGKALLSGLGDAEYESLVSRLDFEPMTPSAPRADVQSLRMQVDRVRRDGVAFDDCEFNQEVRCMASPIRDYRGQIVGAIGFSGPVWRLSLEGMGEFVAVIRSIASEVSDVLGFRPGGAVVQNEKWSRRGRA